MPQPVTRRSVLLGAIGASLGLAFEGRLRSALGQTADQTAIECLNNGDTSCAVEALREAFNSAPFDDGARESLFLALLVHGVRSIDRGSLLSAKTANQEAKELLPFDSRLSYLDEACSSFKRILYTDHMASKMYTEADESVFESKYIEMEGVFGEKAPAFALTQKRASYFNYYTVRRPSYLSESDMAFRFLVYPFSNNGSVKLGFGHQPDTSMFTLTVGPNSYPTVDYSDGGSDSTNWEQVASGEWVSFSANQWHTLEVRSIGQTLVFFIDRFEIGRTTSIEFEPGDFFFGTALPQFANGTFSAAFMDISLYEME